VYKEYIQMKMKKEVAEKSVWMQGQADLLEEGP
jgi:hypothetical protein